MFIFYLGQGRPVNFAIVLLEYGALVCYESIYLLIDRIHLFTSRIVVVYYYGRILLYPFSIVPNVSI